MATLEQIIRPFQAPDSLNKRLNITIVVQAPADIPILSWGSQGTQPTAFGISFKVQGPINQFYEETRNVTPVRIQNPDDDSQYVIAQRVDSINFKKKPDPQFATPTGSDGNGSGSSAGAAVNTGYSSNNPNPSTSDNPLVTPAPAVTQTTPEQDQYSLNQSASPNETPSGGPQTISNGP